MAWLQAACVATSPRSASTHVSRFASAVHLSLKRPRDAFHAPHGTVGSGTCGHAAPPIASQPGRLRQSLPLHRTCAFRELHGGPRARVCARARRFALVRTSRHDSCRSQVLRPSGSKPDRVSFRKGIRLGFERGRLDRSKGDLHPRMAGDALDPAGPISVQDACPTSSTWTGPLGRGGGVEPGTFRVRKGTFDRSRWKRLKGRSSVDRILRRTRCGTTRRRTDDEAAKHGGIRTHRVHMDDPWDAAGPPRTRGGTCRRRTTPVVRAREESERRNGGTGRGHDVLTVIA